MNEKINEIIKSSLDKSIIIEGIAGSGKTKLAVDRVSYILKNYKPDITSKNIGVLATNKWSAEQIYEKLVSHKIKTAQIFTFEEFAKQIFNKKVRILGDKTKLISIINKNLKDPDNEEFKYELEEIKFKSSLEYKRIIDKYLIDLASEILPKNDFVLGSVRIIKAEKVRKLFVEDYSELPFKDRIDKIAEYIFEKIKENNYIIIKEIIAQRSIKIQKLVKTNLDAKKVKTKRLEIIDKANKMLNMLYKEDIKIVDLYLENVKLRTAKIYYYNFINNYLYDNIEDKKLANYIVENTKQILNLNSFTHDDLAPIAYIHYKVYGSSFNKEIKHLVIDNVQDYSQFQFSLIQEILNPVSFTLTGDLMQSVYLNRGIDNWNNFISNLLNGKEIKRIKLNTNYRNSEEIINKIISKLLNENINTDTQKNTGKFDICKKNSVEEIGREISKKVRELLKNEDESLTIICKSMAECRLFRTIIKHHIIELPIISSIQEKPYKRLVIIPAYLTTGLEFKNVIIPNAGRHIYLNSEIDKKLLYLSISRATQNLEIYYTKNLSELLL